MKPLQCPRCGQSAMSAAVKLRLAPGRTRPCRSCGGALGVAWLPYLLVAVVSQLFPFVGLLLAIALAANSLVAALLSVVAFSLVGLWLHGWLVPLVARGSTASEERQ